MGRVCMGRVGYGPSLSWAEFVMGRDVQLPIPQQVYGPCQLSRLLNDSFFPHKEFVFMSFHKVMFQFSPKFNSKKI